MADPDAMKTGVVTGAGRFMPNRASLPALFTHRGAANGRDRPRTPGRHLTNKTRDRWGWDNGGIVVPPLTFVRQYRTCARVEIRTVRHKGLRRLLEADDGRGIRPDLIVRVRNILAALVSAADIDDVRGPPGWRIHRLSGDRAGLWSISVSGNWRITFEIDDGAISDLDFEDYH